MGRISDFFRRGHRVTDDVPTQQLRRPAPHAPILAGNVQGIGTREGQEDSFALVNAADPEAMTRRGLFAVVADGMGGLADGKAVSEAAVDGFLQLFQTLDPVGDVPRQLLDGTCALNDALFQRFGGRSGTTAVAVWIFRNRLHWISVGDSALFLLRHDGVFQINREHTRLNELYLEELGREPSDPARAESDEDARRLSAFLGMPELREADFNRRPFLLHPGDVLLLCSDGISGVLTPAELREAMGLPPDEGCRLLETLVLEKGLPAQDNFTGTMISIQSINGRD